MSSDFAEKQALARRLIACNLIHVWAPQPFNNGAVREEYAGLSDADYEAIEEQVHGILMGVDQPSYENVEAAAEFLAGVEAAVQEVIRP